MGYEREYEKPYPGGWKNRPDTSTLLTAQILDSYDDAFEHIENHLEGSTAVSPIQATSEMTQPVGIDENRRLVTMPTGGGGGSASEITYDNIESGLESTDVQGAIDELAAGAGEKVTPVPKTEDMTQEVGIDENGELWTSPGSGEGGIVTVVDTIVEDAQISSTSAYMTANLDRNPFECKMLWIILRNASTSTVTNVFPDKIPASGNVALNATGISSSSVTVNITETTIGGVNYSGSFQNLWVDIYGIEEENIVNDIYSTEEITTNKIWIDGKPIYRKVFTNLDVLETTNSWTTISSISIANVDVLVNAYAIRSSDKVFVGDCSFRFNNSQLQYYTKTTFPNTDIVVLEYTKTTD